METGTKQVKIGAILSYVLMILNMISGLWMTPYLLKNMGLDEYGLYKLVGSVSASLIVLNLGIGETVQRYTALYVTQKETRKIPNLMAMCMMISGILCTVILAVGMAVVLFFPSVYSESLHPEQISKANILLIILVVNMMFTVIENLFSGLLSGYNDFIFINGIKVITVITRIALVVLAVSLGGDSVALVSISLGLSILIIAAEWIYAKVKLGTVIHYDHWDKELFREAGKYTSLMFLTSLASQAFTNVDNIVIGAFLGTSVVSLYSVGQYFFNLFQQLSCGISGVMLPTITMAVNEENGLKEAEKVVIRAGRMQFLLLGAAFAGVVCIGKEFINLWLGDGYEDVYILVLILVGPSLFELCINVCHSILRAQNKIAFRTYVTFASAVGNAILTIILVKAWGYMGAAVATAITYVVCSLIIMNIYYVKVIKLDMLSIYKNILRKIWICILISSIVLLGLNQLLSGSWATFLLKVFAFAFVYGALLLAYGLDPEEKRQIPYIGKRWAGAEK